MRSRSCLLGVLLFLAPILSAPAQDAPTLQDLQTRYEELDGLRAAFTQVMTSEFAEDSSQIDGSVILSGNKYRVETPTQTVVTNGSTTWIYSPADSQVVVNDADAEASTLTPQTFLITSAKKYDISSNQATTRDGTPHHRLILTASNASARFKEATLWVRRSDRIVTRLRAADRNGSILDLRLVEIQVDPRISEDKFSFSPPAGVEVVDLRPSSSN